MSSKKTLRAALILVGMTMCLMIMNLIPAWAATSSLNYSITEAGIAQLKNGDSSWVVKEINNFKPGDVCTVTVKNETSRIMDLGLVVFSMFGVQGGETTSAPVVTRLNGKTVSIEAGMDAAELIHITGVSTLTYTIKYPAGTTGSGYYNMILNLSISDLKCPAGQHKYETREHYATKPGVCKECGYVCPHTKQTPEYYAPELAKTHTKEMFCDECTLSVSKTSESHVFAKYKKSSQTVKGRGAHGKVCKYCKAIYKYEKCVETKKTLKKKTVYKSFDNRGTYHTAKYKCNKCKAYHTYKFEKHTFKSNKCTICGLKRVKLNGTVTDVKVTVGQVTPQHIYRAGYWTAGGHWTKPADYWLYKAPVTLSFTKPAGCAKVYLDFQRCTSDGNNPDMMKYKGWQTGNYFQFIDSEKGRGEVDILITPYSASGTKGKTVKYTYYLG